MCEAAYRADNWFLPHGSGDYALLASPFVDSDPGAPLPAHSGGASSLFVPYGDCLHLPTHRLLLLLQLSLNGFALFMLAAALVWRRIEASSNLRWSRTKSSSEPSSVLASASWLSSISTFALQPRCHELEPRVVQAFNSNSLFEASNAAPASSSPSSITFYIFSSLSSPIVPLLTFLPAAIFLFILASGTASLSWSLIHGSGILLISFLFFFFFSMLALVMLVHELLYAIVARIESSCSSHLKNAMRWKQRQMARAFLYSASSQRHFLAVLFVLPLLSCSITFMFSVLSFATASHSRRATFVLVSLFSVCVALPLLKICAIALIERFRRSVLKPVVFHSIALRSSSSLISTSSPSTPVFVTSSLRANGGRSFTAASSSSTISSTSVTSTSLISLPPSAIRAKLLLHREFSAYTSYARHACFILTWSALIDLTLVLFMYALSSRYYFMHLIFLNHLLLLIYLIYKAYFVSPHKSASLSFVVEPWHSRELDNEASEEEHERSDGSDGSSWQREPGEAAAVEEIVGETDEVDQVAEEFATSLSTSAAAYALSSSLSSSYAPPSSRSNPCHPLTNMINESFENPRTHTK